MSKPRMLRAARNAYDMVSVATNARHEQALEAAIGAASRFLTEEPTEETVERVARALNAEWTALFPGLGGLSGGAARRLARVALAAFRKEAE